MCALGQTRLSAGGDDACGASCDGGAYEYGDSLNGCVHVDGCQHDHDGDGERDDAHARQACDDDYYCDGIDNYDDDDDDCGDYDTGCDCGDDDQHCCADDDCLLCSGTYCAWLSDTC